MRKAYGFKEYETIKTALYHQLGNLPEPKITHKFYLTRLLLSDDTILSGFIRELGCDPLTLIQSGRLTTQVPVAEIRSRQTSSISVMPEGLLQNLTAQEAADLLSFLEPNPNTYTK